MKRSKLNQVLFYLILQKLLNLESFILKIENFTFALVGTLTPKPKKHIESLVKALIINSIQEDMSEETQNWLYQYGNFTF